MPAQRGAREVDALYKLSINLSDTVAQRLRRMAFDHSVSESSIIEVALKELFRSAPAAQLGDFLKRRGANLRRPNRA